MRAGDVIEKWNGDDIGDALVRVFTGFGGASATTENLTHASVGMEVKITFLHDKDTSPLTVSLMAYDDDRRSLEKSYPDAVLSVKIRSMYLGIDDPDPVPEVMVSSPPLSRGSSTRTVKFRACTSTATFPTLFAMILFVFSKM